MIKCTICGGTAGPFVPDARVRTTITQAAGPDITIVEEVCEDCHAAPPQNGLWVRWTAWRQARRRRRILARYERSKSL